MLLLAIAFVLTVVLSFCLQTYQAQKSAIDILQLRLDDIGEELDQRNDNLTAIRELNDETALAKARAFARMIDLDPTLLTSTARLAGVLLELAVDELHVSDERGILIASLPTRYIGYDMASQEQSAAFLPAIGDPAFELAQDPQPNGISKEYFQYAGVARIDSPGIVQVGLSPLRLQQAMEIADIRNLAAGFRIGESGSIVICETDTVVSAKDADWLGKTIDAYGIPYAQLTQGSGSFTATAAGARCLCLYREYGGYTLIGTLPEAEIYADRNSAMWLLVGAELLVLALTFALVGFLVRNWVIRGIHQVNRSLRRITEGDLQERVNVRGSREFEELSDGVNATVDALKLAIQETAARMDEELQFAREIQRSCLPSGFPDRCDRSEFDVYACMRAAKEVGGDFYDLFRTDERHLAVCVADVSGKGIPAALFMMRAKALIKNSLRQGGDLGQVFHKVNEVLCENNEASMFVTALLGVLDLATGDFAFVNAGHNPPVHMDGACAYLKVRRGFVLGGMEGTQYTLQQAKLEAGDKLFLYTDGVTEAQNAAGELYGEARLLAVLRAAEALDVRQLLETVQRDVDAFAGDAPQADDITMLAVEYRGGSDMKQCTLPARVEALSQALDFINQLLEQNACPLRSQLKIQLAVEEIFVNIASYAYQDGEGEVTLCARVQSAPPELMVQFVDSGLPYNPLDREQPDITLDAEQRSMGGLGILMVKRAVDGMDYSYQEGKNILTIRKALE